MLESHKPCRCGAQMEVRELKLVPRYECPRCAAVEASEQLVALDRGQTPPDLSPLRGLARRALSGNETMPIGDPVPSPALDPDTSSGLMVDTGGFLDDLKSGIVEIKNRIAGGGAGAPGEPEVLPAGMVLGNLELVEPLGQGGMGVVYKARDTSLNRLVAVKVLARELGRNLSFTARFRREAQSCAQLTHPNITVIHSISKKEEPFQYFVMELVDGENLADRVRLRGPLGPGEVLRVARQTAQGLKTAAAQGIIHRDIKPSNLMLTRDGQVKITDFGLAKARAEVGAGTLALTSTGVVMGTPLFMSPEQGKGGTVDQRSDIYSLGATLFFLLYGCPPFEADSPIAIILKHINDAVTFPPLPEVPEPVKALLRRMLAKDVDRRPPDYDALLTDIERIERGEAPEEEAPKKVVVLTPQRSTARRSLFKAGKLSVAKTNLKLRRRDKALSLLQEALEDGDPALRSEAALLMLELFESDGDAEGVRKMATQVLADAQDSAVAAYAAWKLAELDEKDALRDLGQALERYERILRDPPEDLPRALIEAQVKRLRAQIAAAGREGSSTSIVLGGRRD